ncbi:MAG: hypothetical protein AAF567_09955 [Actinomycetota bacterium]
MRDRVTPARLAEATGIAVLVLGFIALLWLDAANGTLRDDVVPRTVGWFVVAFVGFGLVMLVQQSRGRRAAARIGWPALVALGLVLRLVLLATEPTLSDDVYRYLWEGHLVTEGVSPYAFTIDDPAGEAYTIEARDLANNRSLASPYLPVAHGIFGVAAFLLPSEPWVMQLVMIAFDSVAMAMIVRLLAIAGLPRERSLLYWLNPLVIVEVAHGAHLDALILGFGLAGVAATLRCNDRCQAPGVTDWRSLSGPVLLALATLTRPLAVLFLPVLFWRWTWPQRLAYAVTTIAPVAIAGAWVGLGVGDDGTGVFGSARAYTETFRFNSAIYQWLEGWIGGRGLDDRGWNEPVMLTQLIIFGLVGVAMLVVFIRSRSADVPRSILRWMSIPLMIYVVFTPVLHPWYVLLLLALAPFLAPSDDEQPWRWVQVAPWIVMSCLLIFSYLTYENPEAFAEREWVRWLEWFPTLGLLAISIVVSRSRQLRVQVDDLHTDTHGDKG